MFEDIIESVLDMLGNALDSVGDSLQDAYDSVSENLEQALVALGKSVSDDDQHSIIREIFEHSNINADAVHDNMGTLANATDADAYSDTTVHAKDGRLISFGSGDCWNECKASPAQDAFKRMTCGYHS